MASVAYRKALVHPPSLSPQSHRPVRRALERWLVALGLRHE